MTKPPGFISSEIRNNGCTQKAEEGEPVFILLGRDEQASHIVRLWASHRSLAEGPSDQTDSALKIADEMDMYRIKHE